jgi:hypothetical protein
LKIDHRTTPARSEKGCDALPRWMWSRGRRVVAASPSRVV